MVMQAQVIPKPHQRRLAPPRDTWGTGATTTNALWQLQRDQHNDMLSEPVQCTTNAAVASCCKHFSTASRWATLGLMLL
jgi:hypothetical protein